MFENISHNWNLDFDNLEIHETGIDLYYFWKYYEPHFFSCYFKTIYFIILKIGKNHLHQYWNLSWQFDQYLFLLPIAFLYFYFII